MFQGVCYLEVLDHLKLELQNAVNCYKDAGKDLTLEPLKKQYVPSHLSSSSAKLFNNW